MNNINPISTTEDFDDFKDLDDGGYTVEVSQAFGFHIPFEEDSYWEHLTLPTCVVRDSHNAVKEALLKINRYSPDIFSDQALLIDTLGGIPEELIADVFQSYLGKSFPLLAVRCYGRAYEYYKGRAFFVSSTDIPCGPDDDFNVSSDPSAEELSQLHLFLNLFYPNANPDWIKIWVEDFE